MLSMPMFDWHPKTPKAEEIMQIFSFNYRKDRTTCSYMTNHVIAPFVHDQREPCR